MPLSDGRVRLTCSRCVLAGQMEGMDLRHTIGAIFRLTLDLILKPNLDIFTMLHSDFKLQLVKNVSRTFYKCVSFEKSYQ